MELAKLFKVKQGELVERLLGNREAIEHPGEKGAATETSWRKLFETYLPSRYQVDTGFLIDADGTTSDQQDVVVFDRQYSPMLFNDDGVHYMPAESAYAVFEVRQELDKENVEYAGHKIATVRNLRRTSTRIVHAGGEYPPKAPNKIIGGILTTESAWTPSFGERFTKALDSLSEDEQIDIGCALREGAFVVNYTAGDTPKLIIGTRDISLVSFLINFLKLLQDIGTVPAIDYEEYLRAVK